MIKPVERQPGRVAGGSSELEKRDFTILRLDHRLTEVIPKLGCVRIAHHTPGTPEWQSTGRLQALNPQLLR